MSWRRAWRSSRTMSQGRSSRSCARPGFSPSSRHLAYVGQTYGRKMGLVIDGAVSSEWDVKGTGSQPVFSPDSRRVAVTLERAAGGFLRKRSLYTVAVDGRSFPEEPGDDVSLAPAFNPDGTSVAWWLQRGKEGFMVIDGVVQQNSGSRVVSDFQIRRSWSASSTRVNRAPLRQSWSTGDLARLPMASCSLLTARDAFGHVPPRWGARSLRISR